MANQIDCFDELQFNTEINLEDGLGLDGRGTKMEWSISQVTTNNGSEDKAGMDELCFYVAVNGDLGDSSKFIKVDPSSITFVMQPSQSSHTEEPHPMEDNEKTPTATATQRVMRSIDLPTKTTTAATQPTNQNQLQSNYSNISSNDEGLPQKKLSFTCPHCPKQFNSKRGRLVHEYTYHTSPQELDEKSIPHRKCPFCPKILFHKGHYDVHMLAHLGIKPHECPHCPQKFGRKLHMDAHVKAVHLKQKNFSCSICPLKFNRNAHLTVHMRTIHLPRNNRKDKKDQFTVSCPECQRKFNKKSNLDKHFKIVHLKQKDFSCSLCPLKFSRKSHLDRHVQVVHLNQKFSCSACDKEFSHKSNLDEHVKIVHLKQKEYSCPHCQRMFSRKNHLNVHVKAIHLKQKDFSCSLCPLEFSRKGHLDQHVKKVHLKQKFSCSACDKKYSQKTSLDRHVKAVHLRKKDDTDDDYLNLEQSDLHLKTQVKNPKFSCSTCPKVFNYKAKLDEHFKIVHLKQKDFGCLHCQRLFSRKAHLDRHVQLVHLNLKDLKKKGIECSQCDFKCRQKSHLKNHFDSIHLGIKYECPNCQKEFNYKTSLTRHEKKCRELNLNNLNAGFR